MNLPRLHARTYAHISEPSDSTPNRRWRGAVDPIPTTSSAVTQHAPIVPSCSTVSRSTASRCFCGLDDIGPASLDGLLSSRLITYRWVHTPTARQVAGAGFTLMPRVGRARQHPGDRAARRAQGIGQ